MEKAFKLDFVNDKTGSLYVNCCGCSQTAPLHSFGPASKPHYLIHYVLSGKGHFRFHDKEYRLEAGYGFLIQPNELAFLSGGCEGSLELSMGGIRREPRGRVFT